MNAPSLTLRAAARRGRRSSSRSLSAALRPSFGKHLVTDDLRSVLPAGVGGLRQHRVVVDAYRQCLALLRAATVAWARCSGAVVLLSITVCRSRNLVWWAIKSPRCSDTSVTSGDPDEVVRLLVAGGTGFRCRMVGAGLSGLSSMTVRAWCSLTAASSTAHACRSPRPNAARC